MRGYSAGREVEDAVYVGHSDVRKMEFSSSILYTPDGYQ
jgi:hypothetical protein